MSVVNERVGFPENLHDWALTSARVGFLLATLAVPMNIASIGRARLFSLAGAVIYWLFALAIFESW
jgi:hypothetical protein